MKMPPKLFDSWSKIWIGFWITCDIILYLGILYLSFFAVDNLHRIQKAFDAIDMNDDVIIWGVISIPLIALIWIAEIVIQIFCRWKEKHTLYWTWAGLAVFLLILEIIVFLIPDYIFLNFDDKLFAILYYSNARSYQFHIFTLLERRWVPAALFIFQWISFGGQAGEMLKRLKEIKYNKNSVLKYKDPENPDHLKMEKIKKTKKLPSIEKILKDLPPDGAGPPSYTSEGKALSELSNLSDAGSLKTQCSDKKPNCETIEEQENISRNLYYDPSFQPSAWFGKDKFENDIIVPLRSKQITVNPSFFGKSETCDLMTNDRLNDSWLVAAFASLQLNKEKFNLVFPSCDDWNENEKAYDGSCTFRFYNPEKKSREDIRISDELPTCDRRLAFMHSQDSTAFWGPLLEKAVAKMLGSYEELEDQTNLDKVMEFFIGKKVIAKAIKDLATSELEKYIHNALQETRMVIATVSYQSRFQELGSCSHYAISNVGVVKALGMLHFVRLENPFPCSKSFQKFQDRKTHNLWTDLSQSLKSGLIKHFKERGEFLLPLSQLQRKFDVIKMC